MRAGEGDVAGKAIDPGRLRADHVGGLPRPAWVRRAQADYERGGLSAGDLEVAHRDAVGALVRRQEEVGLEIVTDGEVTRRNFQESFGGSVSGFDARPFAYPVDAATPAPGRAAEGNEVPAERAPSGMEDDGPPILHRRPVRERLRLVRNVVLEEYRRASSVSGTPVKVTLIGPDRISQRYAHEASGGVYEDMDAFVADVVAIEREMIGQVVDAGCRYVQIDEPGYTAYVDEPSLAQMRGRGEDPEVNLARGIAADNAVIEGFPGVTFGVHICRGGGGGRGGMWYHRRGTYDAIAERLYGGLAFDRFLLEYDSDEAGGFDSLRYLPAGKVAVLGLVSNHGPVEDVDYVQRRIDEASRWVDVDAMALCPRCGFSGGGIAEEAVWDKLALVVRAARELLG